MAKLLRVGECNQCGSCCDPATIPERLEVYARAGFAALLPTNGEPCPHFRYRGGKGVCGIYPQRPDVCRIFPRIPEDIEALPCGYRFIWVEGVWATWRGSRGSATSPQPGRTTG